MLPLWELGNEWSSTSEGMSSVGIMKKITNFKLHHTINTNRSTHFSTFPVQISDNMVLTVLVITFQQMNQFGSSVSLKIISGSISIEL